LWEAERPAANRGSKHSRPVSRSVKRPG